MDHCPARRFIRTREDDAEDGPQGPAPGATVLAGVRRRRHETALESAVQRKGRGECGRSCATAF